MAKPIPISRKVFLKAEEEREAILNDKQMTLTRTSRRLTTTTLNYIDHTDSKKHTVIITNELKKTHKLNTRTRQVLVA